MSVQNVYRPNKNNVRALQKIGTLTNGCGSPESVFPTARPWFPATCIGRSNIVRTRTQKIPGDGESSHIPVLYPLILSKLGVSGNIAHGVDIVVSNNLQVLVNLDTGVLLEVEPALLEIICRWANADAHDDGVRVEFLARLELDRGGFLGVGGGFVDRFDGGFGVEDDALGFVELKGANEGGKTM